MPRAVFWKKGAAYLLMLCFVLPLSKCEARQEAAGQAAEPDFFLFGHEMAYRYGADLDKGDLAGLAGLASLFLVFFLPALTQWLREPWQSALQLAAGVGALYMLAFWVFLFATAPQYGGLLAIGAWLLLMSFAVRQLWCAWRKRKEARPVSADVPHSI